MVLPRRLTLGQSTLSSFKAARLFRLWCFLVALLAPFALHAQDAPDTTLATEGTVQPYVRALIVHITAVAARAGLQDGAGIVVGDDGNWVYVATARHVVTEIRDPQIPLDSVRIEFEAELGYVDAVVDTVSTDLDLAVIRVLRDSAIDAGYTQVLDRLGDSSALRPGSDVRAVGCPGSNCWAAPPRPDAVLSANTREIGFQSTNVVRGGSSGGGLFNSSDEVVGMVYRTEPPGAYAYPMEYVLQTIESWGRPVSIRRRTIPRQGYGWTLGGTVLSAIAQPAILSFDNSLELTNSLDSRAPSVRLTLTRRTSGSRSWHVGALRLAPANVTITAATAGLDIEWRNKSGWFMARAFGEGAAGRVTSRWDAGGYVVNGSEYVAVWDREERDGVGFGGGVTLEFTGIRNTIFEITGGGWSFSMPENAPDIPLFYIGGGVRLGL